MSSIFNLKKKLSNIADKEEANITFLNPFSYLFFRKNQHLFSSFDMIFIDGFLLVVLLRIIGIRSKRTSFDMTSLAPKVFERCINSDKSIYFIGSDDASINSFITRIQNEYPRLNIVGFRNGYFKNDREYNSAVKLIVETQPDVLVVGMGTPKQEQFLIDFKKTGGKGIGYTCGGFIHQTAKGINYYPKFFNQYNLRWLYRIIDEPKLLKRYLFHYPLSICLFTFDAIQYKLRH